MNKQYIVCDLFVPMLLHLHITWTIVRTILLISNISHVTAFDGLCLTVLVAISCTKFHHPFSKQINVDKEECKNDIKEWSRAFLEANGREPNVQDKATVKVRIFVIIVGYFSSFQCCLEVVLLLHKLYVYFAALYHIWR